MGVKLPAGESSIYGDGDGDGDLGNPGFPVEKRGDETVGQDRPGPRYLQRAVFLGCASDDGEMGKRPYRGTADFRVLRMCRLLRQGKACPNATPAVDKRASPKNIKLKLTYIICF